MDIICNKIDLEDSFNETEQTKRFVRKSEIDELAGWIYRGEWALVIGPLYSNKSIVLKAAYEKVRQELASTPPVFLEYQLAEPRECLFIDDLLEDIRFQLCNESGIKSTSIEFLSFRESLSKLCASLQGQHVVIFIHDIDRLEGAEAEELAQQFRQVYNWKTRDENLRWLSVVISGRRQLRKLSSQPIVAPLHLPNQIQLGELSLEETLHCLQHANEEARVLNLDQEIEGILSRRIWEETNGHSHLTIRLIEETLGDAQSEDISQNTVPKVFDATISDVIRRWSKIRLTEPIEEQEGYIYALLTELIRGKDSLEFIWNILGDQVPERLNPEVADRLLDDHIIRRKDGNWLIHNRFLRSFLTEYFTPLRVAAFKASLWNKIEYWDLFYQEALK